MVSGNVHQHVDNTSPSKLSTDSTLKHSCYVPSQRHRTPLVHIHKVYLAAQCAQVQRNHICNQVPFNKHLIDSTLQSLYKLADHNAILPARLPSLDRSRKLRQSCSSLWATFVHPHLTLNTKACLLISTCTGVLACSTACTAACSSLCKCCALARASSAVAALLCSFSSCCFKTSTCSCKKQLYVSES